MRKILLAATALLALAACHRRPVGEPKPPAMPGAPPTSQAASHAVAPAALPQRTPGLWEQKVSAAGRAQISRVCLDQAAERRFTWWGQHTRQGACAEPAISRRPDGGWDFVSRCDMGQGGRTSTQGTVTGDPARRYRLTARSTVAGAAAPEMNGSHELTLEASWQGPCPAGMQPGDVILPGGMRINMLGAPAR